MFAWDTNYQEDIMKFTFGLLLQVLLSTTLVGSATAQENKSIDTSKPKVTVTKLSAMQKKAKEGDPNAQFILAVLYETGLDVSKDLIKAAEWFQKAAEQGDIEAQFKLAHMYEKGEGIPKDSTKAVEWYRKAAEQGYSNAQFALGGMYAYGIGIPKDFTKATAWWQKAAEQGHVTAQFFLAGMYQDGNGVPKDSTKAAEWFQKAAEQGDAEAQTLLGNMLITGIGVPKNPTKAVELYRKAAEQGHAKSQFLIGTLYEGTLYESGEDVPKDYTKAVEWYRKAAAQAYTDAQANLGYLYVQGLGVSKNNILAYAWWYLAAAQGSDQGQQNRNRIEPRLTPEQRAEGQRLASNWKKGDTLDGNISGSMSSRHVPSKISTGTAFIISKKGHAVTNDHVIHDCAEVKVSGRDGVAKVIAFDSVNDLALLQLPNKVNLVASLRPDIGKLRQGEDILVFGYPLNSVLSSSGNLTPGIISAITGLGNNTNQIQITAPIQPGSSGSPVIDRKGNVVAVVSMKLDDVRAVRATGSIPQNVNFATNGQTLKEFLDTNKVPFKIGEKSAKEKHNTDIAEEAYSWTVLIECWK
jgi:uncharacterized protein